MDTVELQQPKAWIGIDQSYSGFGLAVLTEEGYHPELWKFPKTKKVSEGERLFQISVRLVTYLLTIAESYSIETVAMEGYAYGAKLNREKLGELGGIVKLGINIALNKDAIIIPPRSLKLFVTGNGNASKEDMIAAVQKKWSPEITDNNLADALGLAFMAKDHTAQI